MRDDSAAQDEVGIQKSLPNYAQIAVVCTLFGHGSGRHWVLFLLGLPPFAIILA